MSRPKRMPNWKSRSLANLERWPSSSDGEAETSFLIRRHQALIHVPVGQLDVEGLRLLIGQDTGLYHLIPLALEVLEEDALAEGDLYPGDLMMAVLSSSPPFWREEKDVWTACLLIVDRQHVRLRQEVGRAFERAASDFRSIHAGRV